MRLRAITLTLTLVMVGLMACTTGMANLPGDRAVLAPTPTSTTARLAPSSWADFESWAPRALETLAAHYEVPRPSLALDFAQPELFDQEQPDGTTASYYLRGWYRDGLVVVIMRDPQGDRDLSSLQQTLLHEFIHHLRHERGEEDPQVPHNAEFDRLIGEWKLRELTGAVGSISPK